MTIAYAIEPALDIEEFLAVLHASTLAERRPVDDRERIARMLKHATLIITARDNDIRDNSGVGKLVGVARSLTDFGISCYMADLAVDVAYQRRGIGKELIEKTRERIGPECALILLAAPAAADYYGHVGFTKSDRCWVIHRTS